MPHMTFTWLDNLPPNVWEAVRTGSMPLGILADWLEENGRPVAADEVRELAASYATFPALANDVYVVVKATAGNWRQLVQAIGPAIATMSEVMRETFAAVGSAVHLAALATVEALPAAAALDGPTAVSDDG
jgi:hypothetical protein